MHADSKSKKNASDWCVIVGDFHDKKCFLASLPTNKNSSTQKNSCHKNTLRNCDLKELKFRKIRGSKATALVSLG